MNTDGGYIFPQSKAAGGVSVTEGGMTLRDYFVGQALAGGHSLRCPETCPDAYYKEERLSKIRRLAAEDAYALAEAVIKEKHRREEHEAAG